MSETVANKTAGEMIFQYFKDFKVLKETGAEYWGVQVINFLDCTMYFAMLTIASVFLSENIGLSDEDAGYVLTLFTSATTIFLFFSGMVTDWLGIRRSVFVAMTGLLLLRGGLMVLGLVDTLPQFLRDGLMFLGFSDIPDTIPHRGWIAAVLFFLMAPLMAMIQTVFQAANRRFTTPQSRLAGFSLWYLFMNVGAALGGFLIDIVRLWLGISNAHIFTFGVFTAVLCMIALVMFVRREEQYYGEDEQKPEEQTTVKARKNPFQIAKEVLSESAFWRLAVLIALLLGVRAVFAYMYLLMPKYWLRTIGPDAAFGTLNAINPILIIIGIILFIPFANRFNLFKMLVYGAMISALSLFALVLPWQFFSPNIAVAHYKMAVVSLVLLSVGELIWSPKLSEYTAAVAPEGQEGTYLGLTMVPWFLAKTVVSILSGHMLTRWSPEGIGDRMASGMVAFWDSPAAMWLILGVFAIGGPIVAIIFKGWFTAGARWEHGHDNAKA